MVRSSSGLDSQNRQSQPAVTRTRCWVGILLVVGIPQSAPSLAEALPCPNGPVILVHGLEQGPEIFATLIDGLISRGIERRCVHAIRFSTGNLPIRFAAEHELAPFVETILARMEQLRADPQQSSQAIKVNLVGHSMGALSTRWYATRVQPDKVRTWISTSGANHGTNWQCSRSPAGGHGEMCPAYARDATQSAVQFALNGGPGPDFDETPHGYGKDSPGVISAAATATRSILYLTVQAADDAFILPGASLAIDGAGGVNLPALRRAGLREISPGNFLLTTTSGHDELLASDAVIDLVFHAVTADRPVACAD